MKLNIRWMKPLVLVAVFFAACTVRAEDKFPTTPAAAKVSEGKFKSGNVEIQALRFEPPGEGKRPTVIMLHGADGWAQMPGYKFAAAGINANGQIAILIRFYDRTKTPDKVSMKQRIDGARWLKGDFAQEKENESRQHFEEWIETVQDAVAYARKLPNVDGNRIAIVGFSLGGYLAMAAAPKCDPPARAVVEMFGGVPEETRKTLGKLPPTLIVHGEEDDVIPVNEAYKAAGIVLAQKQHVQIEIQRGIGHVCCKPGTEQTDLGELIKARNHMTTFLKKQLELPE